MTVRLEGEPVAARIRNRVTADLKSLEAAGKTPTLATIAMTDDPTETRFLELKHQACEAIGIDVYGERISPSAPAERLYEAVAAASDDPDVDAVFLQVPLADHVDDGAVRELIDPRKDVDCFHPANLGRVVASESRVQPATCRAIFRLLDAYDIDLAGTDVTVIGRSRAIGRPLSNLLWRDKTDAVTVCHSRTADLAAKTRRADVVVSAAGTPGLLDGSMLGEGAIVVDVGGTRVETDDGYELLGDVEYDSASEHTEAITPVPGGVGPVTLATLLESVVALAEAQL